MEERQLKIELFIAKLKIILLNQRLETVYIKLATPFMFPGIRFEVDPDGTDTKYHRTPDSDQAGFC